MADHPVENTIEIIVTDGSPSGSSSSPQPPANVPDVYEPPKKPPLMRDEFGRFRKRAESGSAGVGGGRTPPAGPPPPVPPPPPSGGNPRPGPGSMPNPDDPPPYMWPEITDVNLRRRFWREHRRRVNNSMSMQQRAQNVQNQQAVAIGRLTQNVPTNFQPQKSPQQRATNWKAYQKQRSQQQAAANRQQRQQQAANQRLQSQIQRRQKQQQRLLKNVPKSFQPNVKNAQQRADNWKAYQKNQKQQATAAAKQRKQQQAALVQQQKLLQRRTAQSVRQQARNAARVIAQRAAFGRSVGSSIGAGLGARAAGPWGAAAGAQLGAGAGGRIVQAVAANPTILTAIATVAVPLVAGYVTYKVFDSGHKAFNRAVSDGIVPFTKNLARAVPIIGNFVGTFDAAFKMLDRDSNKFRDYSPRLMSAERMGEAQNILNRMRLSRERGMSGNGTSLDEQMSEMAKIKNRATQATEQIEASFSRAFYQRAIPLLESVITHIEKFAQGSDEFFNDVGTVLDKITGILTNGIMVKSVEELKHWRDGEEVFEVVGALKDALVAEGQRNKAKEHREMAAFIGGLGTDLNFLLHGSKVFNDDPVKRKGMDEFIRGNRVKPQGLPGMAGQ